MYTKEQYESDLKIVENAPKGATHICLDGDYYRCNNNLRNGKQWDFWDSSQIGKTDRWDWVGDMYLMDLVGIRSLQDIKQKISLYETVEKLSDALRDELSNYHCPDASMLKQDYCDRAVVCSTCRNKRYLVDLLKELTE